MSKVSYVVLLWFSLISLAVRAQSLPTTFDEQVASSHSAFLIEDLGDVDGDGHDDFLASRMTPSGASEEIRSGLDANVIRAIVDDAVGATVSFQSVEGIDDFDGDGVRDLVLYAAADPFQQFSPLRLRSSVTDLPLLATVAAGYRLLGPVTIGDVNFDGVSDLALVVGLNPAPGPQPDTALQVMSGADGQTLQLFAFESGLEISQIVALGDVNADGAGDFLVTAALADVQFPESGGARLLSGLDLSTLQSWSGFEPNEEFGTTAFALADLNGDGSEDFLVFSPNSNEGSVNGGEIGVYSSLSVGVIYKILPGIGVRFLALTPCGDLDGDGVRDFQIRGLSGLGLPGIPSPFTEYRSGRDGSAVSIITPPVGVQEVPVGDLNADGIDELMSFQTLSLPQQFFFRARSVLGAQPFGVTSSGLDLRWISGTPQPAQGTVELSGASANAALVLAASLDPLNGVVSGTSLPLFVDPQSLVVLEPRTANSIGEFRFDLNLDRQDLTGIIVYLQMAQTSGTVGVSNGLEILFGS